MYLVKLKVPARFTEHPAIIRLSRSHSGLECRTVPLRADTREALRLEIFMFDQRATVVAKRVHSGSLVDIGDRPYAIFEVIAVNLGWPVQRTMLVAPDFEIEVVMPWGVVHPDGALGKGQKTPPTVSAQNAVRPKAQHPMAPLSGSNSANRPSVSSAIVPKLDTFALAFEPEATGRLRDWLRDGKLRERMGPRAGAGTPARTPTVLSAGESRLTTHHVSAAQALRASEFAADSDFAFLHGILAGIADPTERLNFATWMTGVVSPELNLVNVRAAIWLLCQLGNDAVAIQAELTVPAFDQIRIAPQTPEFRAWRAVARRLGQWAETLPASAARTAILEFADGFANSPNRPKIAVLHEAHEEEVSDAGSTLEAAQESLPRKVDTGRESGSTLPAEPIPAETPLDPARVSINCRGQAFRALANEGALRSALDDVGQSHNRFATAAAQAEATGACDDLRTALAALETAAATARSQLPEDQAIQRVALSLQTTWEQLTTMVGNDWAGAAIEFALTNTQSRVLIERLGRAGRPNWPFWLQPAVALNLPAVPPNDTESWAAAVALCLEFVRDIDDELLDACLRHGWQLGDLNLALLPAPHEQVPAQDHLRQCLDRIAEDAKLPEWLAKWRDARLRAGWSPVGVASVVDEVVDEWAGLRQETAEAILAAISAAGERSAPAVVELYGAAIQKALELVDPADLTMRIVERALQQRANQEKSAPKTDGGGGTVELPDPAPAAESIEVGHVYVDTRKRAAVSLRQEGGPGYIVISLGLAVKVRGPKTRPGSIHAVLALTELNGAWAQGLVSEAKAHNEEGTRIDATAWVLEEGTWIAEFAVPLCVRRAIGRPELNVSATVAVAGQQKATSKLTWENFEDYLGFSLDWPAQTSVEDANSHPVGPQREKDEILQALRSGQNAVVVAPRRFGKTTLLRSLFQELQTTPGYMCIKVDALTETEQGRDRNRLWRKVDEELQRLPMQLAGWSLKVEGALPQERCFDILRQVARRAGIRYIVLFIDEAQILFPGDDRGLTGDQLKGLLEGWGPTTDMAGVLFCLVGIPALQARAGTNFCASTHVTAVSSLQDPEVTKLIAAKTQGRLETTKLARDKIREYGENLAVVRDLLTRLKQRADESDRRWVGVADAEAVVCELRKRIRDGEFKSQYIFGDPLNDCESVNEWEPCRAYPAALALAYCSRPSERNQGAVLETLEEWLELAWPAHNGAESLRISNEAVADMLRDLRMREVIAKNSFAFKSRLLSDWLEAQLHEFIDFPEDARKYLHRCASVAIALPPNATQQKSGGQATVFRAKLADADHAYRIWRIDDDRALQEFVNSQVLLDRLIVEQRTGNADLKRVFKLIALGVLATDPRWAVQQYHWVDGPSLAELCINATGKKLSVAATARLGSDLAATLATLHGMGILHRDVKPDNIIFDIRSDRLVFIDFGLARLAKDVMTTQMVSTYAAPETRRSPPNWTAKADVYGLAKVLLEIVDPADKVKLQPAVERGLLTDPTARATAAQLTVDLEALLRQIGSQEKLDADWAAFKKHCDGNPVLAEVVMKRRDQFSSIRMGLRRSDTEIGQVVADICNLYCEARTGKYLSDFVRSSQMGQDVFDLWRMRCNEAHFDKSPISLRRGDILNRINELSMHLGTPQLVAVAKACFAASTVA